MSYANPIWLEGRRKYWTRPDAFEREVLALRHDFAKLKLEYELRRLQRKYSPNQSRVPAGNPEGGQWTSGGGADGEGVTEFSAARKMPAIVKEFGKWTARQYVSRYCEAKVNRELPGEFENMTIADIWNLARGGDTRARTCMKLMRPRFGK